MKPHSIQLFFLLICLIEFGKAQRWCTTPFKRTGICVDIQKCSSIHSLVALAKLSSFQEEFLRESKCDPFNDSKVCCQAWTTPIAPTTVNQPAYSPRPKKPKKPSSFSVNLPQPPYCGLSDALGSRIYGGRASQIYDFPWMAIIEYTLPDSGQKYFDCGGVLINPNYVLTAAHCATSKTTGVRLGEWDQRTNPDRDDKGNVADPVKDVPVIEVIPHEDYNTYSLVNDIALLRLGQSVTYSRSIKPICLPSGVGMVNINFDHIPLIVAGFGQTENDIVSSIKLWVEVQGFPQPQCQRLYRSLTLNQLCAGGKADQDSCNGDSGGPLMYIPNPGDNITYLAGVVSFGPSPCGQEGQPGVYTRVSKYINWIENNIKP